MGGENAKCEPWFAQGAMKAADGCAARHPVPGECSARRQAGSVGGAVAAQGRTEILGRLAAIDAARSRPLGDLGQYEEFVRQKLTALETERTALATELAGLEQAG
jgi:hypothetical protein